jgi:integrase
LVTAFETNRFQKIPAGRIICFAVATAMRQDEISRIEWADFDPQKKILLVGASAVTAKDWKMLRRYTHLKPEALHKARAREAA